MAGLKRYRGQYAAATVGKEVHSRSGKNLPVGRPRRVFDRQEVLQLRARGLSYRQIARCLGIGEGTVRRVLNSQIIEAELMEISAIADGTIKFERIIAWCASLPDEVAFALHQFMGRHDEYPSQTS